MQEWPRDIFASDLWAAHHAQMRTPERTAREADFLEHVAGPVADRDALDIPCGNGRVAWELARRGARVVGVDFSARLLDDARAFGLDRAAPPEFIEADMRDWRREGAFDLVACLWGSIGCSDDADTARIFSNMRAGLRSGGALVLDTPVLDSFLGKPFGEPRARELNGLITMETPRWRPETSRLESEWVFVQDGVTERFKSSIRLFSCRELGAMLRAAGHEAIEIYGSRDLTPFAAGDRLYRSARAS